VWRLRERPSADLGCRALSPIHLIRTGFQLTRFRLLGLCILFVLTLGVPAEAKPRFVAYPETWSPGSVGSYPFGFASVGGLTVFTANDGVHGAEPWVTDGTTAGTKLLLDCTPGPDSSSPQSYTPVGGRLYFSTNSRLWSTDGTSAGTVAIGDLDAPSSSCTFHDAGSKIFVKTYYGAGVSRLWQTTGAPGSLQRIEQTFHFIAAAVGDSGRLYFMEGNTLWVTDGSLYGTRIVYASPYCYFCSPTGTEGSIFRFGGAIFFTDLESDNKIALRRIDAAGATVSLISADAGSYLAAGVDYVYLRRRGYLYRTGGTAASTAFLVALPDPDGSSQWRSGTTIGNTLYATTSIHTLWRSAGTPSTTFALSSAEDVPPVALGSRTFFQAQTRFEGAELWSSDGTVGGTGMFADLRPGPQPPAGSSYGAASSTPADFSPPVNGTIYFSADNGAGRELWRTDGTLAGTYMLSNIAADVPTGSIVGTVLDAATSAPVQYGWAAVYSSSGNYLFYVDTDTAGNYRFDNLTPDTYYVVGHGPGRLPTVWEGTPCYLCTVASAGTPIVVRAGFVTTGIDFRLAIGAQISGKVIEAATGVVPAGYNVYVEIRSAGASLFTIQPYASGDYDSGDALPPGTYFVTARQFGISAPLRDQTYAGVDCSGNACIGVGTPVVITGTTSVGGINFALHPKGTIRGRVTDATTSAPVAAIPVTIYSGSIIIRTVSTDSDGYYDTGALDPGTYKAAAGGASSYEARLYGGAVCAATCDPATGQAIVFAGGDSSAINFALHTVTARIAGLVRSTRGSSGVLAVPVKLYNAAGSFLASSQTNSAGRFDLSGLGAGNYYLTAGDVLYDGVTCPGGTCLVTAGKPIVVQSGDSTYIELTNDGGYLLSGRVIAYGQARPGAVVALHGAVSGQTTTDANGRWFYRIKAGTGTFTISAEASSQAKVYYPGQLSDCYLAACPDPTGARQFDAASLTTDLPNLDFVLSPYGTIQGSIVDPINTGVSGWQVDAFNGTSHFTAISSGFSYYISVPPGFYRITVSGVNYQTQRYPGIVCGAGCDPAAGTAVVVAPGGTAAGIDMQVTSSLPLVAGRVTDAVTGLPIPGAVIAFTDGQYNAQAVCDAEGHYLLHSSNVQLLHAGTWHAAANAESHYQVAYGGALCPGPLSGCGGTPILLQNGATISGIDFALPRPVVTSFSVTRGSVGGGTVVTLTGSGFVSQPVVSIGGTATVLSWTPTQIVLRTPPHAVGLVAVILQIDSRSFALDIPFTYVLASSRSDYNGDSRSDLFWRNQLTGDNALWYLSAFDDENLPLPSVTDTTWRVQAVGDFNGDGMADLFWRNSVSGDTALWLMNGNSRVNVALSRVADLGWQVQGSGDFDGDGKADLFWRNGTTGGNAIWLATATGFTNAALPTVVDTGWKVAVIADVTGDGKADVIWRNPAILATAMWAMNGTTYTNTSLNQVSADWTIIGAADVNGDGIADLFWHNAGSGGNALWTMGATITNAALPATPGSWVPLAVGDFTGAGHPNVFWRDANSDQTQLWTVSGPSAVTSFPFPYVWRDWQPTGGR
jgi:ELWxxDGT repeat protein